ncbi:ABC transporter permease/M1 family aminopeptidase [Parapedobacter koreensis]|uniref:ABC-2 type transport system permease protein n=1 Tax=Parapedobacter koreensis TaxID=332977 RepID=A0A1H7MZN1_9SPHI|nr:M1 family aminopeptidase [Parapedobacter koreensis]SEL16762.1 ABC-2 type transport system permease protein [Parapedobacter koreensis]
MFSTIFNFEVKRWVKNWPFFIYFVLFFGLALLMMASALGVFDGVTVTTSSPVYVNSPIAINELINGLAAFVYFLLPTIIGGSVYRDFRYNVHTVLFSYPLTKASYLSAKFLSALVVTVLITLSIGLGFITAAYLPNVNQDLLGPVHIWSYFEAYVLFVIPNIILFGAMVFAVVTISRNVYIGFIFVLLLFLVQTLLENLTRDMDNRYLAALIDPFGQEAISYYTKYWTVEEQNSNLLPFFGVVLYNRLIWLGVGFLILFSMYITFSFSHNAYAVKWKREKAERTTKNNFGSIVRIDLPKISFDYSFFRGIKTAWFLSRHDTRFIVRNWTFVVILILTVLIVLLMISAFGQLYGTNTYPVTWMMLQLLGGIYSFFLQIMIFLFSGMLMQRAATARMDHLINTTAVTNWTLLLSKFFALLQMTCLVLLISMLTAIGVQIYSEYYNFEIGHYLVELFVLDMLNYLVLILFALFIHSFFKNYFVGFFVLLLLTIGMPLLSKIGVEQDMYKFNTDPGYNYSDMNGYGGIRHYVYYKLYWLLLCGALFGATLLFWRRGILSGVRERLSTAMKRAKPVIVIPSALCLLAFAALGYAIYYQNNVAQPYYSAKEREMQQVDYEKKYKQYKDSPHPRIVDVRVDMDIFPKERNYHATVHYRAVNKHDVPIDTLYFDHGGNVQSITIGGGADLLSTDSVLNFDIYTLNKPLAPNDTLLITAVIQNKPNSFLSDRSPVLENGTFLSSSLFPSLGYHANMELADQEARKKYGLPERDRMADPTDSAALQNTYISEDADWVSFETTVSTSDDQIAIAPGYLQRQWSKDGRRYFHYKMDRPMLNFYAYNSARYEVMRDKLGDINLEIYYHKGHEYNLDRMMASMKASLRYYSETFSPYQFKQMRIIEFPITQGTFAQSFANTVPFSEGIGFIADVDESDPDAVDYPYAVISHEVAHQWWAHQVIGANVKGATLLSESLSEYSSLKVLEQRYGQNQMRKFLKDALDKYLSGRAAEKLKENPLMLNENQQYIHYNKGSLVAYAMSDYLGTDSFNTVLRDYVAEYAFQEPPYTTSIEFVDHIRRATPDSLQYLIKDLFETITLYNNAADKVTAKALPDGRYQVDMEFRVSKYRTDEKGKRSYEDVEGSTLAAKIGRSEVQSLPLRDYIEIGIFGASDAAKDNPLYLRKHRIDGIVNKVSIIVDEKPIEVGIDPYNKLIDRDSDDNRKKI